MTKHEFTMPPNPLALVASAFFVAVMVAAMLKDMRDMRIPNMLSLLLAVGGLAFHAAFGTGTLLASVGAAFVVLAGGLFLFSRGWIGAGDVKFAAAAVLWLDPAGAVLFVVSTSLFGAAMAAVLVLRRWLAASSGTGAGPPRIGGFELPYGGAIAAGALVAFAETRLGWI